MRRTSYGALALSGLRQALAWVGLVQETAPEQMNQLVAADRCPLAAMETEDPEGTLAGPGSCRLRCRVGAPVSNVGQEPSLGPKSLRAASGLLVSMRPPDFPTAFVHVRRESPWV